MNDPVIALCNVARFALSHAQVQMDDGEAKDRIGLALAALNDGIDQRTQDLNMARTLGHLEVLADALAAPGKGSE